MGRPVGACAPIKVVEVLQSHSGLGTNQISACGLTTQVANGVVDEPVGNEAMAL